LVTYAGAERVLEQMLRVYPDAEIFSLVDYLPPDGRSFIHNKVVQTSFIQKLPWAKSRYRAYLALMPLAIEQFNFSEFDVVISSSHAVAKGIITGPDQLHICMCYSPIRYAWDLQHQYLRESGLDHGLKGWFAKYVLHKIRIWDYRTASGVDEFIAISKFIQRRIHKVYRRDSVVVYPPVYVEDFANNGLDKGDYYFTASRMVPYKKIDLIVETFSKALPGKKLVVIGDGPDFQKISALAGPNVTLLGYQKFSALKQHLAEAKAFVFAAEEDFGIAPLEAQASGTPVVAFGKGGALETIIGLGESEPSGLFFEAQSIESLAKAINRFEENEFAFKKEYCVANAQRFSDVRFREEFENFVEQEFKKWKC
jgi:glycosyltransferase involved in cell wall biosynthesis